VATLCALWRGAGTKQTTSLEPLVAQQSSERPPTVQAIDSGGVSGLGREFLYLSLDASLFWDEYCLIRLAVVHRGRTLPVVWRVLKHRSTSVAFSEYREMLYQAAHQWFRGNSYFRIGWDWVKAALEQGWPLIHHVRFTHNCDLEPSMASRKQHEQCTYRIEFKIQPISFVSQPGGKAPTG